MLVKGIMTQLSGSLGGIVGSHNAGGLYLRARSIPVNPNTSYQQAVRSFMAALATRWQDTLTAAQRAAWNVFASNMPVINRLGDTIYLTGLNHFVRGNLPRLLGAGSQIDDGPTTYVMPTFTSPVVTYSEATQQASVAFDNTDAWANEDAAFMFVFISRPVAPTINYFKGPYRYAGKISGNGTTPPTSPATIAVPFAVTQGQKVFTRAIVSRVDGRLSPDFRAGSTVAA
jgi:hypothetical protein